MDSDGGWTSVAPEAEVGSDTAGTLARPIPAPQGGRGHRSTH